MISLIQEPGGNQNLFYLDYVSQVQYDNSYFKNPLAYKGLLSSDEVLVTQSQASLELVKKYAYNGDLFFEQFAKSTGKLANLSPPLRGPRGEFRKH